MRNEIALYDDCDFEECYQKICQYFSEYIRTISRFVSNDQTEKAVSLILEGIRFGIRTQGYLAESGKAMIKSVFSDVYTGSINDIYAVVEDLDSLNEKNFSTVISQLPTDVSIACLRTILGFTYANGSLDTKTEESFEKVFGIHLMRAFMNSDQESVPVSGTLLQGLEAEIMQWLEKKTENELVKESTVYTIFYSHGKQEVEKAIKNLENKGLITRSNILGKIHVVPTGEPYRISKQTAQVKKPSFSGSNSTQSRTAAQNNEKQERLKKIHRMMEYGKGYTASDLLETVGKQCGLTSIKEAASAITEMRKSLMVTREVIRGKGYFYKV